VAGYGAGVSRWYAILVSLLVCGSVLWPLSNHLRDEKVDGFPLSWYPMFRGTRPEIERPRHVVGIHEDGHEVAIPYNYWASGGFNQGRNQLTRIINLGTERREELCEQIARRVRKRRKRRDRGIVEIQIVRSQFDRVEYFRDGITEPRRRKVYTSCPVKASED